MLPGESYVAAVRASLDRLGPGWAVVRGDEGVPLDDAGSLRLVGDGDAGAEALLLSEAVAAARDGVAAAVAIAATTAEGERSLPTVLGGPAVWRRCLDAAVRAGAGLDDPHAVVVVRTDDRSDRVAERTAALLHRGVRGQDVVCRLAAGTYAVLGLSCPEANAHVLADRLVAALLDGGVGAAAGAAAGADPHDAQPPAAARADQAWTARAVIHL